MGSTLAFSCVTMVIYLKTYLQKFYHCKLLRNRDIMVPFYMGRVPLSNIHEAIFYYIPL